MDAFIVLNFNDTSDPEGRLSNQQLLFFFLDSLLKYFFRNIGVLMNGRMTKGGNLIKDFLSLLLLLQMTFKCPLKMQKNKTMLLNAYD